MSPRLLPALLLATAGVAAQPVDPRVQCEQWADEDGVADFERAGYLADCMASLEGEWPETPEDAGTAADEDTAEDAWDDIPE